MQSRRHFMRSSLALAAAMPGMQALSACSRTASPTATVSATGRGLIPDPRGILDLPQGFSYVVVSRMGDVMSDGLLEPGAHDGMSCFPVEGDADRCILVRNHELTLNETGERGAFGPGYERLGKVDRGVVYDWASASHPYLGGTTTLLVNLKSNQVERSHMSLIGTCHNCAGGPTPWGSWLSCEESSVKAGDHAGKDHGFVFEVPAAATRAVTPTPLRAMGRFVHEAVAIDPTTGIAYMTEDQGDGLIYRFLPDSSGELAGGGRLQALAITAQTGADLRNWTDETDRVVSVNQGQSFDARWIDLDRVDAPDNDLRLRGRDSGAAIFARGEGMAFALENNRPVIYFASTSGGKAQKGQIWRYHPSEVEGQSDETSRPGKLELFVESLGTGHFDYADNIVAAPIGDIVMCEDGDGDNFVRGVTSAGHVYPIARNAMEERSEFTGVCFSPDGATMFVNIQRPGLTLAVRGPWRELSKLASTEA